MDFLPLDLAPLLARRELWLLLSVAYVDPYQGARFELIQDPAFRRRALDAGALLSQEHSEIELGPGEANPKPLSPAKLFRALDTEWQTLEATYRQLFGLTAISQLCPPCEIEYEPNTDVAYRSQRMADIAGFYRAFGLQVTNRAGERLDHIAVEAEFLYVLLAKEAAAQEVGNQAGAEVCCDARRKFFQEHVGWWLPAFSRLLSRVAPPGYYRELAGLAAALSAGERISLKLPPFQARVIPKPSGVEAELGCLGCVSGQQDS